MAACEAPRKAGEMKSSSLPSLPKQSHTSAVCSQVMNPCPALAEQGCRRRRAQSQLVFQALFSTPGGWWTLGSIINRWYQDALLLFGLVRTLWKHAVQTLTDWDQPLLQLSAQVFSPHGPSQVTSIHSFNLLVSLHTRWVSMPPPWDHLWAWSPW